MCLLFWDYFVIHKRIARQKQAHTAALCAWLVLSLVEPFATRPAVRVDRIGPQQAIARLQTAAIQQIGPNPRLETLKQRIAVDSSSLIPPAATQPPDRFFALMSGRKAPARPGAIPPVYSGRSPPCFIS